jgi:hypothetical protein
MLLDALASQEYSHVFADTISLVAVILCVAVINGHLL